MMMTGPDAPAVARIPFVSVMTISPGGSQDIAWFGLMHPLAACAPRRVPQPSGR